MTKEQIKARVCELFEFGEDKWFDYEHEFMTLAAEIAATEREACAAICDAENAALDPVAEADEAFEARACARLIRARSNAGVSVAAHED